MLSVPNLEVFIYKSEEGQAVFSVPGSDESTAISSAVRGKTAPSLLCFPLSQDAPTNTYI